MIKSTVGRHARVQLAAGPWAPGQHAPAPPMSALSAPQVAPPLRQPRPSKAATPYQQAVQPPGKSTGRGVTVDSPSDRAAPMASHPRGARGATSNVPSTTTSEVTLPQ